MVILNSWHCRLLAKYCVEIQKNIDILIAKKFVGVPKTTYDWDIDGRDNITVNNYEHKQKVWQWQVCCTSAEKKKYENIEYMHENGYEFGPSTFGYLVLNGDLKWIKYMYEISKTKKESREVINKKENFFDVYLKNFNLECLEFLHQEGFEIDINSFYKHNKPDFLIYAYDNKFKNYKNYDSSIKYYRNYIFYTNLMKDKNLYFNYIPKDITNIISQYSDLENTIKKLYSTIKYDEYDEDMGCTGPF